MAPAGQGEPAPATFWRIENAEAMLMLRRYLKAGRFDDLVEWSIASAAPWWPH